MIGFGSLWNAVKGGKGGDRPARRTSTVPRALGTPRTATFEPSWAFSDDEQGDTRGAERFVPNRTATVLTTAGGKRVPARIINISRTGVALEPNAAGVAADEITLVGTRPVLPGRRIALGMVLIFKKPLDSRLCGPDLVL